MVVPFSLFPLVVYGFRVQTNVLPFLHHSCLWSCRGQETCQQTLFIRTRVHFAKMNGILLKFVSEIWTVLVSELHWYLGPYRNPTGSLRSVTYLKYLKHGAEVDGVPFTRNFCKWWLVSFVLPSGMRLGAVHSWCAHSAGNRPSVVHPVFRPSLLAVTKIFLICVAGYLPREQTASVGGGIRHRTASGRQPGIAGAQHIAAAGETAQLACTAQ